MIWSYSIPLEQAKLRNHSMVGIYPLGDRIAYVHFAAGLVPWKEADEENRILSYVLLDTFAVDFSDHRQACLTYSEPEALCAQDAICYWDKNRFLLNTKGYTGFGDSIAKCIQITDTELMEIGAAPAPMERCYPDGRIYTVGPYDIFMASSFIMECREHASNIVCWRVRLHAYLYTELEARHGMLYFGTAGKGGRFYGVGLDDGAVRFSYDTGGTVHYAWYQDHILLANRKGKPVLLDCNDGTEVRGIPFGKWKFTIDQLMLVREHRLYAVASRADTLYAVCADL